MGPVSKKMEGQSNLHWRSNHTKWIRKSRTEPPTMDVKVPKIDLNHVVSEIITIAMTESKA